MNRVQFLTLTVLSGLLAFFIILQFGLSLRLGSQERDVRQASGALQQGQADFQHLQQIATRVAQLSASDDALKDLLTRNNIQINNNGTNAAPAAPAPATH